jgi:UTP--glucose-1-phosphate uridylyltransferase
MQHVTKAVIPVAGYGTRFLPVSKGIPKEMLPLMDKPIIQFIIEEMVASGIEEIILVTSQNKRVIEDYFDRSFELEYRLDQAGKTKQRQMVQQITELVKVVSVRQTEILGNGHALLQAKAVVGNEPFAFAYGDDVIMSETPVIQQMIDAYEKTGTTIVGVKEGTDFDTTRYGVVDGEPTDDPTIHRVKRILEKPGPDTLASRLVTTGRFVFTPEIFSYLEQVKPGKGGEIWLNDAIDFMLHDHAAHSKTYDGIYFDCGNKLEFAKAFLYVALRHPEIKDDFAAVLKSLSS